MSVKRAEYDDSINDSYADFLKKKEAKGKWISYWAVLCQNYLKFYETNKCEKLLGSVEIESRTKCVIAKHKSKSYEFTVCAAHGRYLFKCMTETKRHHWMRAIHIAIQSLKRDGPNENKVEDLKGIINAVHEDDDNVSLRTNFLMVAPCLNVSESLSFPSIQGLMDECENELETESMLKFIVMNVCMFHGMIVS
ncbi:uncharacterized protein LOC124444749 isoform X1 [Xenia sp. Carnegie-2017]|uniref:uncharacterized protein LOC124444749 isoform X1 n=1 Tax=Xenia sp. Carnegie-2017 TaxID=2897299 RepID=UPI001F0357FF|nr:uncharacterized protein LOC124444749 isoform X1 [Xenia sp. Carnegie-2017]